MLWLRELLGLSTRHLRFARLRNFHEVTNADRSFCYQYNRHFLACGRTSGTGKRRWNNETGGPPTTMQKKDHLRKVTAIHRIQQKDPGSEGQTQDRPRDRGEIPPR